jgi:hypothetical protein
MKKLLISGCSITHGAELDNGFMSNKNIEGSFSTPLAEKFGMDRLNVAMSGSSNEYIFHSLLDKIYTETDLGLVIAVWTYTPRLYWKANNRHWFFNLNWGLSTADLFDFEMHDKNTHDMWLTGDSDEVVDKLSNISKFIITDYLDVKEQDKKTETYKQVINDICTARQVPCLNLSVYDLEHIGTWKKEKRHPNSQEHIEIADFLYNYINKRSNNV